VPRFVLVLLFLASAGRLPAVAQSPTAQPPQPMIVDELVAGMTVTTQGCVKPAERGHAFVFTQVTTWPVVRRSQGPYGARHFAIRLGDRQLEDFVGDTVQLTGLILKVEKSEIETEPGLHRYGRFIEVERPDENVLVRAKTVGLTLTRDNKRPDIPVTLLEYEVVDMIRVKRGCLDTSGAASTIARRR
jgi:hypothetical protein